MSKITIARALKLVKRLAGKVAELNERLQGLTVYRDDKPQDFKFEEVLAAHDQAVAELMGLRVQIAIANATTQVEFEGKSTTLTGLLHEMNETKGRKTLFQNFSLQMRGDREHTGEFDALGRAVTKVIPWKLVMTEPERVAKLEELQNRIAALDELIEETNHRTLLVA
jgi:hypothetical protein